MGDRINGHAVNAIRLDFAGCHFREAKRSEERFQVNADAGLVPICPARAALTFRDDFVFFLELVCRFAKRLFCFEETGARLAAQTEIPVFGKLFGLSEFVFFGANAELTAVDRCGALPVAAVTALVDLNESAKDFVACHSPHLRSGG